MSILSAQVRALIACTLVTAAAGAASAQTAEPEAVATPISAPATVAPSPKPTESQSMVRADLGKLDTLAQRLTMIGANPSAAARIAEIGRRWPQVRSELVGQGASRSDLIASDSAVRSLRLTSEGTGVARAANAVTAAFAPLYPSVGDKVPARIHRLDYLQRSMMLDLATRDWVRANTDSISARSTWRAARATVSKAGADKAGTAYSGALDAVQDAIGARSEPRFRLALARADRTLGSVEKALDNEEPPWRRFLHSVGF